MTASEQADVVHFMEDDIEVFRQIDYLWLFNEELKFDKRPEFKLEDSSITVQDYKMMHAVNRKSLTNFIILMKDQQNESMLTDDEVDAWADECLDEEIKELLAGYQNGALIPLDIVSHMEYFYNTLDCDFKVEDPFKNLLKYPALTYKDMCLISDSPEKAELTLYEKHK